MNLCAGWLDAREKVPCEHAVCVGNDATGDATCAWWDDNDGVFRQCGTSEIVGFPVTIWHPLPRPFPVGEHKLIPRRARSAHAPEFLDKNVNHSVLADLERDKQTLWQELADTQKALREVKEAQRVELKRTGKDVVEVGMEFQPWGVLGWFPVEDDSSYIGHPVAKYPGRWRGGWLGAGFVDVYPNGIYQHQDGLCHAPERQQELRPTNSTENQKVASDNPAEIPLINPALLKEEGFYRTRDGRKAGPWRQVKDGEFAAGSESGVGIELLRLYTSAGKHRTLGVGLAGNPALDLVAPWEESAKTAEEQLRIPLARASLDHDIKARLEALENELDSWKAAYEEAQSMHKTGAQIIDESSRAEEFDSMAAARKMDAELSAMSKIPPAPDHLVAGTLWRMEGWGDVDFIPIPATWIGRKLNTFDPAAGYVFKAPEAQQQQGGA